MTAQTQYFLFTAESYHRLFESGIMSKDERVELVSGRVLNKPPVGGRHAACVKRLNSFIGKIVGDSMVIGVQDPIALDDYSEPEPDLVLLKPRADFYADAHPSAQDVLLAIEVGDTSALHDREIKIPLYAKAGVPEVWLIDLQESRIEVYSEPVDGRYKQVATVDGQTSFSSPILANLQLTAADILG